MRSLFVFLGQRQCKGLHHTSAHRHLHSDQLLGGAQQSTTLPVCRVCQHPMSHVHGETGDAERRVTEGLDQAIARVKTRPETGLIRSGPGRAQQALSELS